MFARRKIPLMAAEMEEVNVVPLERQWRLRMNSYFGQWYFDSEPRRRPAGTMTYAKKGSKVMTFNLAEHVALCKALERISVVYDEQNTAVPLTISANSARRNQNASFNTFKLVTGDDSPSDTDSPHTVCTPFFSRTVSCPTSMLFNKVKIEDLEN